MNSPTMVACHYCQKEIRLIDASPLWHTPSDIGLDYICREHVPPLNERQKRMLEIDTQEYERTHGKKPILPTLEQH